MYRPPSLFGGVKNGFQGVPERYKWVPHAMLANRRSRAGYPPSGTLHRLTKMQLRLAIYRGYPVQLLILYYQNRYFVLSNYDIIGSNKFVPFSEFELHRI